MTNHSEGVFRFLDLPVELRLIVYERLPVTTRHHALNDPAHRSLGFLDRPLSKVAQVTKCWPVELLRTCHRIYSEARPIAAAMLGPATLRYVFEAPALGTLVSELDFNIFNSIRGIQEILRKEHETDLSLETCVRTTQHSNPKYVVFSRDWRSSISFHGTHPPYAAIHRFMVYCARWSLLIKVI
jgi:hypothetical protein